MQLQLPNDLVQQLGSLGQRGWPLYHRG